jgi:hypothetical protein
MISSSPSSSKASSVCRKAIQSPVRSDLTLCPLPRRKVLFHFGDASGGRAISCPEGHKVSQRRHKLVERSLRLEEDRGWPAEDQISRPVAKSAWISTFAAATYNLVRMRTPLARSVQLTPPAERARTAMSGTFKRRKESFDSQERSITGEQRTTERPEVRLQILYYL